MSFPFKNIAILGLGLIGSSVARAVHDRKLAGVHGYDHNEVSLAYSRKHGFVDKTSSNPAQAVKDCDLVIIATPPSGLEEMAKAIAPRLMDGALVMDVCSVKQAAIESIVPHLPKSVDFMPAHPIAGGEQSGIAAGRADLFNKKRIIITPANAVESEALQKVTSFWRALGGHVEAMPPHLHDMIYAYVSHLPQLLAFAAGATLVDHRDEEALKKFLRISRSNAGLWVEILLCNRDNVLKSLDRYLDALNHIEGELAKAPEDSKAKKPDKDSAAAALFPRIAASCLVTTVMEAEKKAGFPFARYSGGGFADFTSPAASEPDKDIERISNQYQAVKPLLKDYNNNLKNLRKPLFEADDKTLAKAIKSLQ